MNICHILAQITILITVPAILTHLNYDRTDIPIDEDDEILKEAILKRKRTDINDNFKEESIIADSLKNIDNNIGEPSEQDMNKRDNSVSVSTLENQQAKEKEDTATTIVNDVNKYGLWEYTADNTDMGDQMKKLMANSPVTDTNTEGKTHSLEKQATQMNEKINKYLETDMTSTAPTIDPLETPVGYSPTNKPALYKNTDSDTNPSHSDSKVDIVTIPNTMMIEDEHGNSLDTVKIPQEKPASRKIENRLSVTSNDQVNLEPTSSHEISTPAPLSGSSDSLTARLLKALKHSKTFRLSAEKLLPKDTDTEKEVAQKQRKLALYLNAYEKATAQATAQIPSPTVPHQVTVPNNGDDRSSVRLSDKNIRNKEYQKIIKGEDNNNLANENENDQSLLMMIKDFMRNEGKNLDSQQIHRLLNELQKSKSPHKEMQEITEQEIDKTKDSTHEKTQSLAATLHKHLLIGSLNRTGDVDHKGKELHKGGLLTDYTTSATDFDHPLGMDGPESPLLGYLEQETAAVSNIKDGASTPTQELERLQQIVKHKPTGETEQQKLIYSELNRLIKEKEKEEEEKKENESQKERKIAQLESSKNIDKEKAIEELRQEKLVSDLTKEMDDGKEKERSHDHALTSTYFDNNDEKLLKQFRQYMTNHNKVKNDKNGVALRQSKEKDGEGVITSHPSTVAVNENIKNDYSDKVNPTSIPNDSKAMESESSINTDKNFNVKTIEDQLKEIQLEKEMLTSQEEKLKSLSEKVGATKTALKNDPIAELKAETSQKIDHKLEETKPAENDDKIETTLRQNDIGNVKIVDHKLHLAKEKGFDMVELSNNPNIAAAEEISKTKNIDTTHKINEESGNVNAIKMSNQNLPSIPENKQMLNGDNTNEKTQSLEAATRETSEIDTKSNNSNDEFRNTSDLTNSESESKNNPTVNNMWKEVNMTDNENVGESVKDNSILNNATPTMKSTEESTNKDSIENKTNHKEQDEKVDLPINNPKPTADIDLQPHANFHTSFHSHFLPQSENPRIISPHHSLSKHSKHSSQSLTPTLSPGILKDFNTQKNPTSSSSLLKIKHFRHKELSPTTSSISSEVKNPHFTQINEMKEPSLIEFGTDSNHRAIVNSPNNPLIGTPFSPFPKSTSIFNSINNFIKHKTIPASQGAHFIKPKSTYYKKAVDVIPSKKGFGKPPKKPKSYLIKELKHKLNILALKRNIERHLLKRLKHRNKYLYSSKQHVNNTAQHHAVFRKNSSTVLVPVSKRYDNKTINDDNKTIESKNVIVPGSTNRYFTEKTHSVVKDSATINPSDVTRSILPKAKSINPMGNQPKSIEEVFSILDSTIHNDNSKLISRKK